MPSTDPRTASVVVVRALRGLGDVLCAVPALRLLRESLPEASITLIGIDETESLVRRFSRYVDRFVPFPGWPGIPEVSKRVAIDAVRNCSGADVVVQMHGDGSSSNGFCASLAPNALVAYGTVDADVAQIVSTEPYPESMSETERCIRVASRALAVLGIEASDADPALEFPIGIADTQEAEAFLEAHSLLGSPFACIHPGAHAPERRWPAERFVEIGRTLLRAGLVPVVTGTIGERPLARRVLRGIGPYAVDATGMLSLGGTAALLSHARGLISNDTGISHLAAALGTPSVVVFTGSNPRRWAPASDNARAVFRVADPNEQGVLTPDGCRLAPPSVDEAVSAATSLGIAN